MKKITRRNFLVAIHAGNRIINYNNLFWRIPRIILTSFKKSIKIKKRDKVPLAFAQTFIDRCPVIADKRIAVLITTNGKLKSRESKFFKPSIDKILSWNNTR